MPRKRDSGDGALYAIRGGKLWRAVIDDGFHPDGRRRQRVVTSKTNVGARRKLDAIKDQIKQHGTALDTKTAVEQWATHWLETVGKPNLKPNTLLSSESVTRNWIIPTIGAKKVAFLKPSDVRIMTKAVADAGRSSSTSRKAFQVLSLMLESARVEGIAARNVCEDVDPPAQAASNRGALSTEAALSVLQVAAEHDDGTRWRVALLDVARATAPGPPSATNQHQHEQTPSTPSRELEGVSCRPLFAGRGRPNSETSCKIEAFR